MSYTLKEVSAFLCGEAALDGVLFGDKPPTERGMFWWRKHLRAALAEPDELAALRAEVERLRAALSQMLTHMGMDEDEWNAGTFRQAREALAAAPAKEPPDPLRDPRVLLAACLLHPLPLSLSSAIKEVLAAAPAKEGER